MRLDEFINTSRDTGSDVVSFARLAAMSPYGKPTTPSFIRLGKEPEEWITTKWGTQAALASFPDPDSMAGIAEVFRKPIKTVVLATAESVFGVPMFTDPVSEAGGLLPHRWQTLAGPRMALWHRQGEILIADQDREAEVAAKDAEIRRLTARVQELEAAQAQSRRKGPRSSE